MSSQGDTSSAQNEPGVISFQGQQLKLDSAEDAKPITDTLTGSASHGMHTLVLEGNTLGIPAAEAIGQSLETLSGLKRALLKDLFTGRLKNEVPVALKHLLDGVTKSGAYLEELDLSDNAFGPIGMESVKPFLQSASCERLEVLRLNNNGLGLPGGSLLADAIEYLTNLRTLIVGRNRLASSSTREDSVGKIAAGLATLSKLEALEMPQNGIRVEGIISLAQAVESNRNLRVLNLNDNSITPKGAKPLASALSHCNNLQSLNLGDCLLKNKGTIMILKALISGKLKSLKEINLSGNEISSEEVIDLISVLVSKTGCEPGLQLDLSSNSFGEKLSDKLLEIPNVSITLEDDEGTADEEDEDEEEDDVSEEEEEEEKEEVERVPDDGDKTGKKVVEETIERKEFVVPRPVEAPFASYSSVSEEDDKSQHGSDDSETVANDSLVKNLEANISSIDNEVSALLDKMESLKIGFSRDQEESNTSNSNGPSESQ